MKTSNTPCFRTILKPNIFRTRKIILNAAVLSFILVFSLTGVAVAREKQPDLKQQQELIQEIASLLQACSYDGNPLTIGKDTLKFNTRGDGENVVKEIMKFTGLPQNFIVVPGKVPNAAAIILLDKNHIPHRIIAYNKKFMTLVNTATKNNNWAPISIMAHEIGHHLCGHTLTPGGSQPPFELEADKFSGFVLQKMGASVDDAKLAMETLVSDKNSPTHPKRSLRVAAIKEGWTESCKQQGVNCDPKRVAKTVAAAQNKNTRPSETKTGNIQPQNSALSLPAPNPQAIPTKFDRFILDEANIFDPKAKETFARRLYDHAQQNGVEIVIIAPVSLHGKGGDDYAYDMMRQLRVGKLEAGNGVVLILAPTEKQVGVALGAGVYTEFQSRIDSLKRKLSGYLKNYQQTVDRGGNLDKFKRGWAENAFGAADHIMRDTQHWEWFVRYQNLDEIISAKNMYESKRKESESRYDPDKDPTWRKLVRVEGILMSRSPSLSDKKLMINDVHARNMKPMHFKSEDGKDLIIYFNPMVEQMMTVKLQEGKKYSIVGREKILQQQYDNYQFDAVSYTQIGF